MAISSQQEVRGRVRAPRVHIKYEVEKDGAIEMISLPFVLGMMADLTGDRRKDRPLPTLAKREFVDISPVNFDKVMADAAPYVRMTVPNRLEDRKPGQDETLLAVELEFKGMKDFEPATIASKYKPTAELLDIRKKLHNLLTRLEGQAEVDALLKDAISRTAAGDADAKREVGSV
jgi:type VI secretion system protein ImpB